MNFLILFLFPVAIWLCVNKFEEKKKMNRQEIKLDPIGIFPIPNPQKCISAKKNTDR